LVLHRDDLVRLIVHCLATPEIDGPLNATAPLPVRNVDFGKALGSALGRPYCRCRPPRCDCC
jgi:NAD dependent epimerase/dehydratase family enzyme